MRSREKEPPNSSPTAHSRSRSNTETVTNRPQSQTRNFFSSLLERSAVQRPLARKFPWGQFFHSAYSCFEALGRVGDFVPGAGINRHRGES
jgi:hypothetical protein